MTYPSGSIRRGGHWSLTASLGQEVSKSLDLYESQVAFYGLSTKSKEHLWTSAWSVSCDSKIIGSNPATWTTYNNSTPVIIHGKSQEIHHFVHWFPIDFADFSYFAIQNPPFRHSGSRPLEPLVSCWAGGHLREQAPSRWGRGARAEDLDTSGMLYIKYTEREGYVYIYILCIHRYK